MYCNEDLDPPDEYGQELTLASGNSIDLKCPKCGAVWKFWASTQLFHKLVKRGEFNNNRKQELDRTIIKDFDGWNKVKKKTNVEEPRLYTVREIWLCQFGVNIGTEQDGSGARFLRLVEKVGFLGKEIFMNIRKAAKELL